MSEERLFDVGGIPEVPLLREPRGRRGAARGVALDARFLNDYPPEWTRCPPCEGTGRLTGEMHPLDAPVENGEVVEIVWEMDPGMHLVIAGVRVEHIEEVTRDPRHVGRAVGFKRRDVVCDACLGMGSLEARVRLEAGHRCLRCKHPYMPQGDARRLGVEPSGMVECPMCEGWGRNQDPEAESSRCQCGGTGQVWTPWSLCDVQCTHADSLRMPKRGLDLLRMPPNLGEHGSYPAATGTSPPAEWFEFAGRTQQEALAASGYRTWDELIEAGLETEWRILTVHHLDGDKANCRWWNLAALCQRDHLEIQSRVVMERVYPFEHSAWFKPHAAGYYAFVYLGLELTREEVAERLDELLALERQA